MRKIALLVVAMFTLATAVTQAEAGGRPARSARPSKARSDGVWQKRDGWGGFGWYSIYGDFVGNDGYTYTAPRYRGPGNLRTWHFLPSPNPDGTLRP